MDMKQQLKAQNAKARLERLKRIGSKVVRLVVTSQIEADQLAKTIKGMRGDVLVQIIGPGAQKPDPKPPVEPPTKPPEKPKAKAVK